MCQGSSSSQLGAGLGQGAVLGLLGPCGTRRVMPPAVGPSRACHMLVTGLLPARPCLLFVPWPALPAGKQPGPILIASLYCGCPCTVTAAGKSTHFNPRVLRGRVGTRRTIKLAMYTEHRGESHPGEHMSAPWELGWSAGGGGCEVGSGCACQDVREGLGRRQKHCWGPPGASGSRLGMRLRVLPGSPTLGVRSWQELPPPS